MAGNETISYSFYLEGVRPMFLSSHFMLAAFRPVVGTELTLPGSSKLYVVVRVEPITNPSNQSNAYYVVDKRSRAAPMTLTGMDVEGL